MLLLFLIHVSFGLLCENMFDQAYDLKDIIAQQIVPENLSSDCILSYIQKGSWDEAEYLISAADGTKVDLKSVANYLQNYKRYLARLSNLFNVEKDPQIIRPSFRWAQSTTHIYLDIKFSHRMDAAGCNEVYDKSIDVKADHIEFMAKCIHSNHKLKFELYLPLNELIDPEATETNEILTGRIEIKLAKRLAPSVWPQVYSGEKPSSISTWWDMQEQFKEEIKQFQESINIAAAAAATTTEATLS